MIFSFFMRCTDLLINNALIFMEPDISPYIVLTMGELSAESRTTTIFAHRGGWHTFGASSAYPSSLPFENILRVRNLQKGLCWIVVGIPINEQVCMVQK